MFFTVTLPECQEGENRFSFTFTPDTAQPLSGYHAPAYEMSSAAPIERNFTVTKKLYARGTGAIYAAPGGVPGNQGAPASPLDIETALTWCQPGRPKTLRAARRDGAFLDFGKSGISSGFALKGSYWVLDGFHVRSAGDKVHGLEISGNSNIVQSGGRGPPGTPHRPAVPLLDNRTQGFTSNSDPAVIMENCTVSNNGGLGFAAYGAAEKAEAGKVAGLLAYLDGDNLLPGGADLTVEDSPAAFLSVTPPVHYDTDAAKFIPRDASGNWQLGGYLQLTSPPASAPGAWKLYSPLAPPRDL